MTLLAVLITLLSSVRWSLFDASRKRLAETLSPATAVIWLMLLQTPLFALLAFGESWTYPQASYWLPAILAIAINTFAHVFFIRSVSLAPFSLAVPVLSLTPVFAAVVGFVVLGESTTLRQGGGILVILGATLALPRSEAGSGATSKDVGKGLALMAVVALLWALAPVVDKIGLRSLPPSEHAFFQCLGIAAALAISMKLQGKGLEANQAKSKWRWLLGAVVFAAAALFFQFRGIQEMPVGIFEALKRSFGLVAALALGFFIFRERVTLRKVAVAAAMGVGIFLLLA